MRLRFWLHVFAVWSGCWLSCPFCRLENTESSTSSIVIHGPLPKRRNLKPSGTEAREEGPRASTSTPLKSRRLRREIEAFKGLGLWRWRLRGFLVEAAWEEFHCHVGFRPSATRHKGSVALTSSPRNAIIFSSGAVLVTTSKAPLPPIQKLLPTLPERHEALRLLVVRPFPREKHNSFPVPRHSPSPRCRRARAGSPRRRGGPRVWSSKVAFRSSKSKRERLEQCLRSPKRQGGEVSPQGGLSKLLVLKVFRTTSISNMMRLPISTFPTPRYRKL